MSMFEFHESTRFQKAVHAGLGEEMLLTFANGFVVMVVGFNVSSEPDVSGMTISHPATTEGDVKLGEPWNGRVILEQERRGSA